MAIFFIFAMLLGAALQLTNAYGDTFLHDFANVDAYKGMIAVRYPAIIMSISQVSETLFILAIPHLGEVHASQFDGRMIASVLYLGVGGTALAFVWYYMSIKRLGASIASIFNNLVPVFGVAISVLVLGEPLLPSMLIGGAIAIGGVMMVSRP